MTIVVTPIPITSLAHSELTDVTAAQHTTIPVEATKLQLEAATAGYLLVPPDLVNSAPGVAKGWVKFNVAGGVLASQNVTSITDTGTGDWDVNWATDFSAADYGTALAYTSAVLTDYFSIDQNSAVGVTHVGSVNAAGTRVDIEFAYVTAFGGQ
jgi:hypothetical protein